MVASKNVLSTGLSLTCVYRILKIKTPMINAQKTITPDPNGKLRLFTKNNSKAPAKDGRPGTIISLMKITIPTLIANAAIMPQRPG